MRKMCSTPQKHPPANVATSRMTPSERPDGNGDQNLGLEGEVPEGLTRSLRGGKCTIERLGLWTEEGLQKVKHVGAQ